MDFPVYNDEAILTLTAINPPSYMSFPHRRILMTRRRNVIPIGRTSKRNSLFGAMDDNAWIDSPVMSREHAEFCLDPNQQRVMLRDIGSLHGTFANNVRLGLHQNFPLQSGDVLRFGIPIERGHETYHPCSLRADVEFGSVCAAERPLVFSVPDETDIEISSDEDDSVENSSHILKRNGIRPGPSTFGRDIIDLTYTEKTMRHVTRSPARSIDYSHTQHETVDSEHLGSSERGDSDFPESRMPTPPETIEIFEEDPVYDDFHADTNEDDFHPPIETEDAADDDSHGGADEFAAATTAQPTLAAADVGLPIAEGSLMNPLDCSLEHADFHSSLKLPPICESSNPAAPAAPEGSAPETKPEQPAPRVSKSLIDIMGQKTGNPAYWAAREHNKSNLSMARASRSASLGLALFSEPEEHRESTQESHRRTTSTDDLPADLVGMEREAPNTSQPDQMDIELSGASSHSVGESLKPQALDDSSAYRWEMSKRMEAKKAELSRLGEGLVQTQLDSSLEPLVLNPSVKRKVEQISPEEQVGAPSKGLEEPRTPKRVRRVAEAFGYAALGGIAVMSALIATAPSL